MKFHYKAKVVSGFYKDNEGYVVDREERAVVVQAKPGMVAPYFYDYIEWYKLDFIKDGNRPWIKGADLEAV